MFLGVILLFYVVSRFLYFATQVDPDIYIDQYNVDTARVEMHPAKMGFQIAVMLESFDQNGQHFVLDPADEQMQAYGSLKMNEIHLQMEENVDFQISGEKPFTKKITLDRAIEFV